MNRRALGVSFLLLCFVLTSHLLWAAGFSLRFFGNGQNDIDRVKIPIDNPPVPADIGSTDITIEFWMKANPGDNGAVNCVPGNDGWMSGNIMFDRDVFGPGDFGDYGISLFQSGVAFGVNNGTSGEGICGTSNVADGLWHHIAVTRQISDGLMKLYVDGALQAQATGPTGDISYDDNRPTTYPNDPYLVIGAEKHDLGPPYLSFSGWIDEVRLSTVIRYTTNFTRPSAPFSADANTAALYHFDEAAGDVIHDSSTGGASGGVRRFGGSPAGPVWSADKAPLGGIAVNFTPVITTGLTEPVAITNAGDGTNRLFITEQTGSIRLWNGSALSTFMTVPGVLSGGERGLLSVAFHPLYETNGYFFVYYTDVNGNIQVDRFTVSANPNQGDPASRQPIINVPHPGQSNHNGGQLQFGPDGYLYMGTGDGGGAGDPAENAQNINVLLGKILRLDINGALPYTIPPDNPFVGLPGADEIWDYGVRNPWRFSFDRLLGDLIIGDVG
ncbi:MAG TPA: PQQ-dependent sugar dehydrogenase, partial [Acidobacteriota bacterium]|nr:PQQ-dependent sugar dehydrogenase [Acidobacteriota bacterium]